MRRNISCEDTEADVGSLGHELEQILSELDRSVAFVVAPCGGSALGSQRRIGVLAAAQGPVAVAFSARDVLIVDMPASNTRWSEILAFEQSGTQMGE